MKKLASLFLLFFVQSVRSLSVQDVETIVTPPCQMDNTTCLGRITANILRSVISGSNDMNLKVLDPLEMVYLKLNVAEGITFHLTNVLISNLRNLVIKNVVYEPTGKTNELFMELNLVLTADVMIEFSDSCKTVSIGPVKLGVLTNKTSVRTKYKLGLCTNSAGVHYMHLLSETTRCHNSETPEIFLLPSLNKILQDPTLTGFKINNFSNDNLQWKQQMACEIVSLVVAELLDNYQTTIKQWPAAKTL